MGGDGDPVTHACSHRGTQLAQRRVRLGWHVWICLWTNIDFCKMRSSERSQPSAWCPGRRETGGGAGAGQGTCSGRGQAVERRVSPGASRRLPPFRPHLSHGLGRGGGVCCGDRREGRACSTSSGHQPSSTAEASTCPRAEKVAAARRSLLYPWGPPGGTKTPLEADRAQAAPLPAPGVGASPDSAPGPLPEVLEPPRSH